MRVWDIHAGYLSRQSLLGQHAEIHALLSILGEGKRGYSAHPETLRWKGHMDKLKNRHDLTVKEMLLRGFGHKSPCSRECLSGTGELSYVDPPVVQIKILREKYLKRKQQGRIPLPKNIYDLWKHYKYSIMARGYGYHEELQSHIKKSANLSIAGENNLIVKIISIMERPVTENALEKAVNHLWEHLIDDLPPQEREEYSSGQGDKNQLLSCIFQLAKKYQKNDFLYSTIFSDLF
ncbi:pyrimidine dimer DNA glycosylase/endonuclease V [Candidatus Contubernalis alkaliaceticus]|uniref:pyrimidine dimer DNA glycosylase/endonuclease V n=1 Tax=Candidatus Contubernalis alkaliaceticus TaxID=338645 RepID=UPI001F4C0D72|nr:pyrimidine dimer DNA glycosylase/endonuclease V [Candidatus Contubernalis alkalaceticus]UNC90732.1 hypothetical protein HUE98_00710 [Candidatus Contubernalis alkalaceticus]